MSLKPPNLLYRPRVAENPSAALDYEIAQEKASALGRLGRRLEATLADLAAFDTAHAQPVALEHRNARRALVGEAGVALWHFVVQREALGLRDTARLLRDYRVPREVSDRMGAFPVPPAETGGLPQKRKPPA